MFILQSQYTSSFDHHCFFNDRFLINFKFLTVLIGPEVAVAGSVGHLIIFNTRKINVILDLTYCFVKTTCITKTKTADQIKSENFKVKAPIVKPKRASYVQDCAVCV